MNAARSLSPPLRLAVAYARADLRGAWELLLSFDDRISGIVGRSSEPIFSQMKIAWWQEALAKPAVLRPQGEPLLAELRNLEEAGYAEVLLASMGLVLDAWGMLAANENWTPDILQSFAKARSKAVFESYAAWVARDRVVAELGQRWAVDDLGVRFGDQFRSRKAIPVYRRDRRLRPLTILALSVRPDASGLHLVWHALTGR